MSDGHSAMLIRLLCSFCVLVGTFLLGGGIFYSEYLYPRQVSEARVELQDLVDRIATIEQQQVVEFNRFILFSATANSYVEALKTVVLEEGAMPGTSNDFRVEAFEEGRRLVLRGYTAPEAVRDGRRPVMMYRLELNNTGEMVNSTEADHWITFSGREARLSSILGWIGA